MTVKEFALPDLGEGLTESELVSWKVAVGDTVQLNQIIAEVETAKALVELPAPYEGRVSQLFVEPGVTVAVGERIVAFEVGAAEDAAEEPAAERPEVAPAVDAAATADAPEPNLVGYGAKADSATRPQRRARPGIVTVSVQTETKRHTVAGERPRATPPVRKLARERGVDLASIPGTGERGLVTRHDVEAFLAAPAAPAAHLATSAETPSAVPGARETRIPIKGVRKATADAMVRSAFTAPQATVFLTVDATPTMELLDRLRAGTDTRERRPGLLTVIAKALCIAVRRTPEVNASWDDAAQEIVQFGYVNLGIAAATPRGLVVPTIRDADALGLGDLAASIRSLAETARAGRTSPEAMSGGTITITNVGVFGVDAGTPILTPGEAAILAVGAVRRQPWEHRGDIALRDVLTLALSFDHRVVDGEQAARFIADIGRIVADPASVIALV
ncbi:branched-chain alpha-keto acid dehydrogenase subunit E2 [Leifsonia sp. Root227]|uniref:dihydrolipoamide acetyltransferase family protein n=1 Tax=Leifsonia sp. Root227 TaxID=1736496 RepID=UPI000700C34B|nr:dihydrolipoamide acetyltransferase family protein [Leifsonia sp. Root227]KRC50626.1 branched-chain alpha-keto acid dehydrogenase subunit E2 [Leifsonia sp. Root227]